MTDRQLRCTFGLPRTLKAKADFPCVVPLSYLADKAQRSHPLTKVTIKRHGKMKGLQAIGVFRPTIGSVQKWRRLA
jgi:hypothetical protein